MKKLNLLYFCVFALFFGCSKSEPKTFEYWNNLVNEKLEEINRLVQSVPCTDAGDFEIVRKGGYYLVHPSVRIEFDRLQVQLEGLEKERNIAQTREGWIGSPPPMIPSHPVRKVCENGKPKLLYVKDLSIEEINTEIPMRYKEIVNFYKDASCTDPNQWFGRYIFSDCKLEAVAIHKTIRNEEIISKVDIYNQMMVRKFQLEKPNCGGNLRFESVFEILPAQCEDGRPVVSVAR